jgi:VanZ family protein
MMAIRFLPAILWTGLIAWFSGDMWSTSGSGARFLGPLLSTLLPWANPEHIQGVIWLMRKSAHVTEYAVLATLWRWAFAPRGPARWRLAFGLSVMTAALDEIHQATTTARTGSIMDVLLDAAAAAAALVLLATGRIAIDRLIGGLLWIAALGGAGLLAINWAVAAPAPWLWPSIPMAWIALFLWRRRAARV